MRTIQVTRARRADLSRESIRPAQSGLQVLWVTAIACLAICTLASRSSAEKPRVFITTDIGINDPDDDQSVCHLLHYGNAIDVVGLAPDLVVLRGDDRARKRLNDVIDAYQLDFENTAYRFQLDEYPSPEEIRSKIKWTMDGAVKSIASAALADDRPLYVLVWGRMHVIGRALQEHPEIASKIRLLTIATNLKAYRSWGNEKGNGRERNWNWSEERDYIFRSFPDLWWVESDWTYSGMFPAPNDDVELHGDPVMTRDRIKAHGRLGYHLWKMGNKHKWSGYFRCGDTPSLNFLLDSSDDDDPTEAGWAGEFVKPFPNRPNYFIGIAGNQDWDYEDPLTTWKHAESVFLVRTATLRNKRKEMYNDYLARLAHLYSKD